MINSFGKDTAKELLRLANERNTPNLPSDTGRTAAAPAPDFVFRARNVFVNNSNETVPKFGLMRVTGVTIYGDRYAVAVDQPDGSTGLHVVNGPRPVDAGKSGAYQDATGNVLIATAETDGQIGPGTDWDAVPGSMFELLGTIGDDIGLAARSQSPPLIGVTTAEVTRGSETTIAIFERTTGDPVDTGRRVLARYDFIGTDPIEANVEVAVIQFADALRIFDVGCEPRESGSTPTTSGF